jgi:hypothetical protein
VSTTNGKGVTGSNGTIALSADADAIWSESLGDGTCATLGRANDRRHTAVTHEPTWAIDLIVLV